MILGREDFYLYIAPGPRVVVQRSRVRFRGYVNLIIKPHLLLCFSSLVTVSSSLIAAERPNIIIFLADDLGYADVGFNGGEDIPTPHIDSIAATGVRFTSKDLQ